MLGFAAEFEIDRPTTEAGWIFLILVGVLLLFLLNEGLQKITGRTYDELKKNVFFFLALLVVAFLVANRENWGSDPLVEVEVLDDSPISGTQAESNP